MEITQELINNTIAELESMGEQEHQKVVQHVNEFQPQLYRFGLAYAENLHTKEQKEGFIFLLILTLYIYQKITDKYFPVIETEKIRSFEKSNLDLINELNNKPENAESMINQLKIPNDSLNKLVFEFVDEKNETETEKIFDQQSTNLVHFSLKILVDALDANFKENYTEYNQ